MTAVGYLWPLGSYNPIRAALEGLLVVGALL